MKNKRKLSNQKIWFFAVGFVILLAIAVIGLNPGTAVAEGLPKEVTVKQASELRSEGAFILDVRQPEEWQAGHIPGATLIPLGELSDRLSEVPVDQEIVVVCRSGNRSATGRDILLDAGFNNVTSMGGGMNVWTNSGYDVVTGP